MSRWISTKIYFLTIKMQQSISITTHQFTNISHLTSFSMIINFLSLLPEGEPWGHYLESVGRKLRALFHQDAV